KKMKNYILKTTAVIVTIFALITIFMSTSVIFDLFQIREKEGNYVMFVVVTNFIVGFTYLFSAYGLFTEKIWTTKVLVASAIILLIGFIGLLIHAYSGGIYETKTISAMIFRVSLTFIFTIISWFYISKK
ncbi:MAG: hypothetical protein ACOYMA_11865, partial [Bacteroidia bacterium]